MKLTKLLATTAIGASLAIGSTAAALAAGEITVVSWGGAYTKSQVEAYHKPWMAATGTAMAGDPRR